MQKQLSVTHGPSGNESHSTVQLNGVSDDEKLTPKMARRAARIACGHSNGVTVTDGEHGYRLYRNSARKIE